MERVDGIAILIEEHNKEYPQSEKFRLEDFMEHYPWVVRAFNQIINAKINEASVDIPPVSRSASKEDAASELKEACVLLKELHAMVWGECPSLLNEDSGGCSRLDIEITTLLERAAK